MKYDISNVQNKHAGKNPPKIHIRLIKCSEQVYGAILLGLYYLEFWNTEYGTFSEPI